MAVASDVTAVMTAAGLTPMRSATSAAIPAIISHCRPSTPEDRKRERIVERA